MNLRSRDPNMHSVIKIIYVSTTDIKKFKSITLFDAYVYTYHHQAKKNWGPHASFQDIAVYICPSFTQLTQFVCDETVRCLHFFGETPVLNIEILKSILDL